jgi:hypothetical protein
MPNLFVHIYVETNAATLLRIFCWIYWSPILKYSKCLSLSKYHFVQIEDPQMCQTSKTFCTGSNTVSWFTHALKWLKLGERVIKIVIGGQAGDRVTIGALGRQLGETVSSEWMSVEWGGMLTAGWQGDRLSTGWQVDNRLTGWVRRDLWQ